MRLNFKTFIGTSATLVGVVLVACSSPAAPVVPTAAPPVPASVVATATTVPIAAVAPADTAVPPSTSSQVVPTATSVPVAAAPSETVPPTATEVPEVAMEATAVVEVETPLQASTPEPPTSTPVPPTATPEPLEITSPIQDFELENLVVKVGMTVTWVNEDSAPHTVTSGTPPNRFSNLWDSPNMDRGQNFTFTFERAGEFAYFCKIHPFMIATVTVTEN